MSLMKLHGALLAKGRLLGVQFLALFKDDLYIRIGRHADRLAGMLKEGMMERGYRIFMDSPTNVIASSVPRSAKIKSQIRLCRF